MRYQVIVGNLGTVLDTNCRIQAHREYESYRYQSRLTYGRASGEPVTLMEDGEPIKEYPGTNHEHD